MNGCAACRGVPRRARALIILLSLTASALAWSQSIYRVEHGDGVPSYADRPAADLPSQLLREAPTSGASIGVELARSEQAGRELLLVRNNYFGPVQIAIYASRAVYESGALPLYGFPVLPARSETAFALSPADRERADADRYHLVHIPGDPAARHLPQTPYRLPYAVATRHRVSQAYPEQLTHFDPSSEHAIDFEMPVGTGVHAARSGMVMDVAADYYESPRESLDPDTPANVVRILHDDGTMALYGHLQLHSIRVAPGDRVERGEHIANSGNTGFSTGPHLHFDVQQNRSGLIVSVPVRFAGLGDSAIEVHSGEIVTAY